MKTGTELIADERLRQIYPEGYLPKHDDALSDEELIDAALCYVSAAAEFEHNLTGVTWPRGSKHIRTSEPGDNIQNLVKAAALLAAEIDRLQRLSAKEAA